MNLYELGKDFVRKTERYGEYYVVKARDCDYETHMKHFLDDMKRNNIKILSIDSKEKEDQHYCSGMIQLYNGRTLHASYIWNPDSWFTINNNVLTSENKWRQNSDEIVVCDWKHINFDPALFFGMHIPYIDVLNCKYDVYVQGGSMYHYAWITREQIEESRKYKTIMPLTFAHYLYVRGIEEEIALVKYSRERLTRNTSFNCLKFNITDLRTFKIKRVDVRNEARKSAQKTIRNPW